MDALMQALEVVFSLHGLLAILAGTAVGITIGALPGLGPSLGIALLIPVTYDMPAAISLILLVSLYVAAEYGGSISGILIGTPGTAAATATVVDGYPLTRKGYPGKALGASLTASTIGGILGTVALVVVAAPLAKVAIHFGPPQYFALGIFALSIVSSLSSDSPAKGWLVAALGLAIVTVGLDPMTGAARFTQGRVELMEGVPYLTALIGLFALSEVFHMVDQDKSAAPIKKRIQGAWLTLAETRRLIPAILRGSVIGTVIGVIPGLGAGVGSWIAYDQEKRLSRTPEEFGKGALAGVAAPESANNAVVGGALIPMLSLGIPGSPTTAVLIGAMVIHGIQPGPQIFVQSADVVYSLFVGMFVACFAMFALGRAASPIWVRCVSAPTSVLAPVIFGLGTIGAYSLRNLIFDVWIALAFGVLGYVLRKFNFPLAPMVLAMVLGYMIESNFRRSLLMMGGSPAIFVADPITVFFLALAILSFFWPLLRARRARRLAAREGGAG